MAGYWLRRWCWVAAAVLLQLLPVAAVTDEVTIMLKLRQAVIEFDPTWPARSAAWRPGSPAQHCTWEGVECNADGHVTHLILMDFTHNHGTATEIGPAYMQRAAGRALQQRSKGAASSPSHSEGNNTFEGSSNASGPLLPELAQLQWLTVLVLNRDNDTPVALKVVMPPEWGLLGAFPRLKELDLRGMGLGGPLPHIHPGALPALLMLYLEVHDPGAEMPASWGSDPAVLPALRELSYVTTRVASLPAEWAHGFRRLQSLVVGTRLPSYDHANLTATQPRFSAVHARLPEEWARGFPKLQSLTVTNLGVLGTIPQAWARNGSFPELAFLVLTGNQLTGTLPDMLFASHPRLQHCMLQNNSFSGMLPDAWATTAATLLELLLDGNQLTGSAFPSAWLQPGSMPALQEFQIGRNPGLNGTLPADLPWLQITTLGLAGSGVSGTVPESWCQAPLARHLAYIWFDGEQLDAVLPDCAKTSMPALQLLDVRLYYTAEATDSQVSGQQIAKVHQGPHAALISLVSLLPLAALVAAGAAGRVLWHRRRRHLQLARRHREAESLLAGPYTDVDSMQSSQDSAASIQLCSRTGRSRMEALLRSALTGQSCSLELMELQPPPGELGQQAGLLGHRLQQQQGAEVAGSSSSESASAAGQPVQHQLQSLAGCAGSALPSRKWRLTTESLRLRLGELQFVLNSDGLLACLGEGAHAAVYLATLGGALVAVKVFELQPGIASGASWREISLLRSCTHPRIVPLYGVALKGNLLFVAMHYAEKGSLQIALQQPKMQHRLRWDKRGRQVALDVAEALHYLHMARNMMHGDLKPGNVLLSSDWRAYLADLGVSQLLAGDTRATAGFSPLYAAPEQLMGAACAAPADMYSFGILLIELLTQQTIRKRGHWRLPRAPQECPEVVLSLVQDCVSLDPALRPTSAQALHCLQGAGS